MISWVLILDADDDALRLSPQDLLAASVIVGALRLRFLNKTSGIRDTDSIERIIIATAESIVAVCPSKPSAKEALQLAQEVLQQAAAGGV